MPIIFQKLILELSKMDSSNCRMILKHSNVQTEYKTLIESGTKFWRITETAFEVFTLSQKAALILALYAKFAAELFPSYAKVEDIWHPICTFRAIRICRFWNTIIDRTLFVQYIRFVYFHMALRCVDANDNSLNLCHLVDYIGILPTILVGSTEAFCSGWGPNQRQKIFKFGKLDQALIDWSVAMRKSMISRKDFEIDVRAEMPIIELKLKNQLKSNAMQTSNMQIKICESCETDISGHK